MDGQGVVALVLVSVLVAGGHLGSVECQLSSTFYSSSCPLADTVVRSVVGTAMSASPIVGPSLLRLMAHDCFVSGCDASLMLLDTPSTPQVERDVSDNLSLQQISFDTINLAKTAVETVCPGVVSCADIMTMAAQDAVSMMGGPSWSSLLGRRDGMTSLASNVGGHLPLASMNLNQLTGIFSAIGMSQQDLVALSGAHTVGFAHCGQFVSRLYNFNSTTGADPSIQSQYAKTLQNMCPKTGYSSSTVQALDVQSSGTFDNKYFQDLMTGTGLLFSDQVLFVDGITSQVITTYANNQAQFFTDFIASMIQMSQVGVLTGSQGEVRLNCSVVNGAPTTSNSSPATPVTSNPSPATPVASSNPPPAPTTTTPSKSSPSPPPPGGRRLCSR